jgi:UDP-N-acetylmuramate--alanine ligase
VASALAGFHGAERRFERHGEAGGVLVVDDYGHHPTEIAAVIAAARATLGRRLVVTFQPHRHSRTAQLMDAFGPALAGADEIVLTEIYAAGEDPIQGVTVERLADSIRDATGRPVHLVKSLGDVVPALLKIVRAGDAVITLGAGSIGTLPKKLVQALESRGAVS